MTHSHGMPPSRGSGRPRGAAPVFTDPSGQRRRLMRLLGVGASVLLVGALILVGIGLFGGPDTPFSVFSAPVARHNDSHDGRAGHSAGPDQPGAAGGPGRGSPSSPARSPRPSNSAGRSSPAPTNRAGKTPPGQHRSKRPHPSPSPSSHAR